MQHSLSPREKIKIRFGGKGEEKICKQIALMDCTFRGIPDSSTLLFLSNNLRKKNSSPETEMITSAYFKMPRMLWVYSPPLVLRKSTEFKARAWEMLLFIAARIVSD